MTPESGAPGADAPRASRDDRRPRLLVVLGATGTGKTALAAELAARLPGEVVSVDASCVYRGLDVGTAKPSAELLARAPHHLVDCCDPREEFSAARFVELASEAIAGIAARGRVPVLAGGTGLYLRCLLRGMTESPPPDAALRERLLQREERRAGSLHRLLGRLDPGAAGRIPAGNVVRTVRALEHRLATGRRLSEDQRQWRGGDEWPCFKAGLELPREARTAALRERTRRMVEGGLLAEVRGLLEAGVPEDARALRAIGYRQALDVLAGRLPESELVDATLTATRQYAKRQDTWFRSEPGVTWWRAPEGPAELFALVERVMLAWRERESTA